MYAENLNLIVCSIKEKMAHTFLGVFLVRNQSDNDTKIRGGKMTYKKFLEKLETLVIRGVINTKDKEAKHRLKEIAKLIVLFRLTKEEK